MSKKYVIAEVNVTADGARVTYLAERTDNYGMYKTEDLSSVFVKKFDTADKAKKELRNVNECVVSVFVAD